MHVMTSETDPFSQATVSQKPETDTPVIQG